MPRFASAAAVGLLALLVTAPSQGRPPAFRSADPVSYIEDAQSELDAMADLIDDVRDYRLRRDLETRRHRTEDALDEARRALRTTGDRMDRYDRRPHGSRDRDAGLSYEDARTIVSREVFDSGKLEAIESVARTGRFTTDQAAALAGMCTFESTKQSALIALYPAVTDPYRYQVALGILDFQSSRWNVSEALGI